MTFRRARCAHCRKKFVPERPSQIVHAECVEAWAEAQAAKRKREDAKRAVTAARVDRAEVRRRKEAIKTIPQLVAEAQREFNAFIRLRDQIAGHPCISSGRPLDWSGNGVDAGHYRSTGAAPHLRFNEDNCHAQAKQENRWLAGNAADYRVGLIARIGQVRVEALESDSTVHKWTREELTAIRDTYRRKAKEMKEKTP